MASIDLNIIDRGIQGTDWTAQETGIQAAALNRVKEQKTDNSGALNSLPTPFARFFVAREAFRRATEQKRHPENKAGLAYTRLVSDCLDVFELLFNKKFHENQWGNSARVIVKEWDKEEQMKELRDRVPILYNALESAYKDDIKEDTLYFVILEKDGKEYLLGTSSPWTGFVTPPDMDKSDVINNNTTSIKFNSKNYQDLNLERKNGGHYFSGDTLFGERDKDFKNYMYQLFGGDNVDDRLSVIRDYIRLFEEDKDIQKNYRIKVEEILTDSNSPLIINGLNVKYNDEEDINNFFMPTLIKLPFRINKANFVGISYEREPQNRDYDFLIPLKREGISYLQSGDAKCFCQVKTYEVVVKYTYNGTEYTKSYDLENDVVDLKANNCNLNIGLFPNILSSRETENNYFKLALSLADNNNEWSFINIDNIFLSFYKDNLSSYEKIEEVDPDRAQNGVKSPIVRSRQQKELDADVNCSTKYYELFNTDFDALSLTIGKNTGFLIPVWRKGKKTSSSYSYAIDLGTSNTFISRAKHDDDSAPEIFAMSEPMVSYLHEYNKKSQYTLVSTIEDSMPKDCEDMMKTEFVPPYIDGTDYKFPIRTAICKARNTASMPILFDNHNIAFFYEKMMENSFEECLTNIKWDDDEDIIRIFVKELLLIIKCDILQRNGNLSDTSIIWFRPLSFSAKAHRIYKRIWDELSKNIIFTNDVNCYTESEAPYYYFKKMDALKNTDSVTIIDIGGGSTDFFFFGENKPISASSVHFGCDVLWGNGHNEFGDVRENGIYNKYIDHLNWTREEYRNLESEMKMSKETSTVDMINFWLSNCKYNNIIDALHDDYSPLFVYHFTAIIYYIAKLYRYMKLEAPRTILFSGNGSRYIDDFITEEVSLIEHVVTTIFNKVYGEVLPIHILLPQKDKRKESTCYGGMYRPKNATVVEPTVYHGIDKVYKNVSEMTSDKNLKATLLADYKEMNVIYSSALDFLKGKGVIDTSVDLGKFKKSINEGYEENLTTHYRSEIEEKYQPDDECNDSVFFIPVIDKIFDLTKLG